MQIQFKKSPFLTVHCLNVCFLASESLLVLKTQCPLTQVMHGLYSAQCDAGPACAAADLNPVFTLSSRGPEEEKQVGLRNPRDPGPAHHYHHHCDPARCRLRDNNGQWHQDHCHLSGGHHPKESKAVNTETCVILRLLYN